MTNPTSRFEGLASSPASEQATGGLIIFLNGTSSSGKSSIARELVGVLDEPCFHMPVDAFHAMRSGPEMTPDQLNAVLKRTWMGFHRAVAGMAAAGNNIVVDHVLSESWRLHDCLALFAPQAVVLVGVRCPLPELERREQARGDRPAGLAARQFDRVHAHGIYDVECDTGSSSPVECAREIKEFLRRRTTPTAFERMRSGSPARPAVGRDQASWSS
ncbi:chloramphenicol phosphotransferase [Streptomyces inhibens]|uniref:Chloramphenicol phosphotransferase n=1 Tax=Streptomyces inhibens TaxID=2293571 RepID=A0A371Q164_STRIH|nr:AAA family ATPase [Streptomyces inhibens]REK88445.1 chloramphenicol phosphotransferase [Streptomyces inhibens]